MATSSEKTLPCTDSKEGSKSCSHNSNAFDIPGMLALVAPDESKIKEESEKLATDPASFNQLSEQLHRAFPKKPEIVKMAQRLHNNLREYPQLCPSLEALGDPVALEKFAEFVAQMKKDPKVKPILDEIDACGPVAVIKFGADKDVLKKLGQAMTTLCDVEGLNNDKDQVSLGVNALTIVSGYAKMKCAKLLLDGEKRRKKRASHNGRKKHVNIPQEMGVAE
uniref:Ankyrin repeat domain-containing protein 2 n=1 Tax=Noccaea caerulescens TaxID=107243 RepID=A0A1J3CY87_NOCCA